MEHKDFCGISRGDVAIKVMNLPGRESRFIVVQKGNSIISCAQIRGTASEDNSLRALRYIATGEAEE